MQKHWTLFLSAMLLLALSVGLVGVTPATGSAAEFVRPTLLAPGKAPVGSIALGSLDPARQISLRLVLSPSHPDGLRTLLANLYDPASSAYHRWLRRGQFDATYGPSATYVAALDAWLKGVGLKPSESEFAVSISAPASKMGSALGTSFERYRSPSGQVGYLARRTPRIPTSLAGGLTGVIGLNTVARFKTPDQLGSGPARGGHASLGNLHADGLSACQAARSDAGSQYLTLDQVGAAYGLGALIANGQNGHGKTIGLYELADHFASDVDAYEACFGLSNRVSTVSVDGGGNSHGGLGTIEADLDIETAVTEAPGASIISYEAPYNGPAAAYDLWQVIVSDDAAQVISTSFGECEPEAEGDGAITSYTTLFEQAAAQGQTITAATGDFGSEDCVVPGVKHATTEEVDFPASDAWVTAVGGTTIPPSGPEVTWNDCQSDERAACAAKGEEAGGGGSSRYVSRPSYQPNVLSWPSAQPCGRTCREVPDISANAGTKMVYISNSTWGYGPGTSFAAPLIAGLVADRNVGCTALTGLFNPALYALYREGAYGTAFVDITAGNNDLAGSNGGNYPALLGYDAATGIGTPLAPGLSCPEVISVGSGVRGGDVTITGLGLEKASFFFGGRAAKVVSADATRAIVVVPPGGGSVKVHATSVLGNGSESSRFTYPTASPTTS
jgi:subtilase family serine protease